MRKSEKKWLKCHSFAYTDGPEWRSGIIYWKSPATNPKIGYHQKSISCVQHRKLHTFTHMTIIYRIKITIQLAIDEVSRLDRPCNNKTNIRLGWLIH